MTKPSINKKSPLGPMDDVDQAFRVMFDNAPFGMCITGMDKKFLIVNRALCQMLGYGSEELMGTAWTDLTHPDDLKLSLGAMGNIVADMSGRSREIEKRFLRRDNTVIWVRIIVALVRNSGGDPLYFTAYMDDISEQKRLDAALDESEDRFKSVADSCPSMMWVTDPLGEAQYTRRLCSALSPSAHNSKAKHASSSTTGTGG